MFGGKWLEIYVRAEIVGVRSGLARVAELVDAPDLGSGALRCGGSTPPSRTTDLTR